MASAKLHAGHARVIRSADDGDIDCYRRPCGCIKTSEKLKHILSTFPAPLPPPSSPASVEKLAANTADLTCISSFCNHMHSYPLPVVFADMHYKMNATTLPAKPVTDAVQTEEPQSNNQENQKKGDSKLWRFISELVTLVQLSVTATALALYYLIYCYMQLVYCTLHTALYFHNADGPMKITIAVVTLTSLVIGFNLIIRLERFIGIIPYGPR